MNEEIDLDEFAPWLLIAITLLGGFLRVLLLGMKGMWLDETFSVWLASNSVVDMLQWMVKIDQHPPLYYLLLHCWIGFFGDSPYNVRLLSGLFGVATIPMIYLIGKRLSGAMVGLGAATFLALSTFHVFYAQETRMYTLLTFNAAVAVYALVRLLADPCSLRPIGSQLRAYLRAWRTAKPVEPDTQKDLPYQEDAPNQTGRMARIFRHPGLTIKEIETDLAWIVFILFSAATMLSHNTAIFFPLATNIYVLGLMVFQKRRKSEVQPDFLAPSLGNWMKAQIAILLLWSPWILPFIKQSTSVYQRFWIPEPTWESVIHLLKSFLYPSAPLSGSQAVVVWSLFVLVLILGLVHFRKNFSRFLFLATLFAVPLLGELIVSSVRPIFSGRTLIWITIPLFLMLGAGIAQLKFRFLMIGIVGILGFVSLFSVSDYFRFYQKEDWSTPAGYVANFAEKGDLILFNSNFVEVAFNYYFKPYEDKYNIQVVKRGVPKDLFIDAILEPEMTTEDIPDLISQINGHDRVWLVYSHEHYTDPNGIIPQTLASERKILRTRDFYGGVVYLYGNP